MDDNFDFSDNASDDEDEWPPKQSPHDIPAKVQDGTKFTATGDYYALRASVSQDLRQVKRAGFKAGYLGSLGGHIIICVSCRIAKLGISEEAMQAWGLIPRQYLVLLI